MIFPTHLNCPYCPAQAVPQPGEPYFTRGLREYTCPARHRFFVEPEEDKIYDDSSEMHTQET